MNRFSIVLLVMGLVLLGTAIPARAQISATDGLNMPGSYDSPSFSDPPTINAFAGVQKVGGTFLPDTSLSTRRYKTLINVGTDVPAGSYQFLFTSGPAAGESNNKWTDVTVSTNTVQSYTYHNDGGGANDNVTFAAGYYTVNWQDNGYTGTNAAFLFTSAAPVTFTTVAQSPLSANVTVNHPVTVTISASGSPSPEETTYVRYSTNNWSTSSLVRATFVGSTGTATLPQQAAGTTVSYYVFSTTVASGSIGSNYDLVTLNANTNNKANYSYTVSRAGVWTGAGGDGLWGTAANWSGSVLPSSTDTATIAGGFNVSINTNFNVSAIILGNGSSHDSLKFDGAATRRDTVTNVIVNAGSRFVGRLNNQAGQDTLRVYGDLTNNGTFDMFPGGNTGNLSNANCSTIVFSKVGNQNVQTTGSPLLTRFGRIAFNKGSNTNKVIVSIDVAIGQGTHAPTVGSFISTTVVSSLFLSGTTNGITQRGTWEQNAGTFYAYTTTISPNANAGFNVIGSASIYDSTGAFFIGCPSLINTSGTITINEGDKTFGFEDTVTISNGTFNIYGQLEVAQFGTPGVLVTVNGGTFNMYAQGGLFETMDTNNVNASSSAGGHLVYIGANGSGSAKTFFTMTGGSMTLVNPIKNGVNQRDFVIGSIGGFTMSGSSTVYVGDGSNSAAGWMGFQFVDSAGTHSLNNLVVQGGTGAPGRRTVLRTNLTVAGNLTIASGSALFDTAFTLTTKGNISNSGTGTDATGGEIKLTGGSSAHTLSGNGTYGNLELNDGNGATLSGSPTIAATLTLTNGTFGVGANTLTIENPIAGNGAFFGADATSSITIAGSASGVNLPAGVTALNNLTINNPNGSTLQFGALTINGVLTMTQGQLTATSPNIVNLSSTGSLSEAGSGSIVLGTVTVTRTVAGANAGSKTKPGIKSVSNLETFGNIGFDIDPAGGTSPGMTTITRVTGTPQGFANQSIKRFYDVSAATNTGLNATVIFHYDNSTSELNGDAEPLLSLWKSSDNGSTWSSVGGVVNTGSRTITQNGITDLSRWTASSVSMVPSTSQQSDIIAGALTIPSTISSYATTQGTDVAVFSFIVRDGGATGDTDHVPTILKDVTLQQGSANTATNWADYLQGAELFDGAKSLGLGTISSTTLSWSNANGLDTIADDGQSQLTLRVWLKTSLPAGADNKVFEFKVNQNTDVNTSVFGSSMAPGGSDVVGSPGTGLAVVAGKLLFSGTIANTVSGHNLAVTVAAMDTNGNLDADYSQNVLLAVFSGSATVTGTNPVPTSAGTAAFSNVQVVGHGPVVLMATSGILLSAESNSFLVDSSALFKVAAGGPNDTLYWDSPSTWNILSGYSHYGVPHSLDHVVLDDSFHTGSYVVKVGVTSTGSQVSDTAAFLHLGYPHNPNKITLLIPPNHTQYFPGAIYWGDGVAGNYDMIIDSGGVLENNSGVVSHNSFNYPAISANDTLWIRKGGTYLHNSVTFQSGIFQMSRRTDGDLGDVVFDVPPFSPGEFDINADGYWYPNLVLSNNHGANQYYLFPGSDAGAMHIQGNLTVNTGVNDSLGTGDAIMVGGDLTNSGTTKFSTSTLVFTGAQRHTISGNAVSLGSGLVSSDSVNLLTNLNVTGGTVQTTGTYIITFQSVEGVYDTIPATGVISTNASSVVLDPAGSLNEGLNPIQGTVSASRTVTTGGQNFGNIGFEVVSAAVAPGATSVVRRNGVALTGNGHSSIKRYYDVTPAVNTGLNASIKVSYAPSELNGVTESGSSPYSPILQKSTDGGVHWSGQGNTVEVGLHKMDATSVQSLQYRWTGADANAPLFISHTLVVDKFSDLDGNPSTKGDQAAKQWRLFLYRDSVSGSTLVNTGNPGLPHLGVLTTTSLESGTYIAVEADSIGWLHIGTAEHGTSLAGILKPGTMYTDTITLDTLHPNSVDTVDFINQQVAVVTIRKFQDFDGNPATIEAVKQWGLSLYKGSVSPVDSVAGANDTILSVSGLQAGTYIAVEADSGASWVRLNGNHQRYDTLTITAGQVLVDTFINFRPNAIIMSKYQDNDGNFATAGDRVLKAWHMEIHQGTANGPLVAQTDASSDSVGGLGNGTYVVTEADSAGWIHLGYIAGVVPVASTADSAQVIVANGQNTSIAFVNAAPVYSRTFRTFSQRAIGFDVDNKGKVNKYVVRKPDKDEFDVRVGNDSLNITDLHVEFGSAIDTVFNLHTIPPSTVTTIDTKLKKWDFVFHSALTAGDSVRILGFARTNKTVKISKFWWTRSNTIVGKSRKDYVVRSSILRLPMPNRVNALAESFPKKGAGLIVGRNEKTPNDSSKYYGWFQAPDYSGVLKTLYQKAQGQPTGNAAHPFDFYTSNGKVIKGQQKSLPPLKEANSLLANMIALKTNIAASDYGFVPAGFGDLIYSDPTTPIPGIDGLTIRQIAHLGDSVMMGWLKDSVDSHSKPIKVHEFDYTYNFNQLDSIIAMIDSAFEGPLDTVKFSDSLQFTGVRSLISVAYLHADPNAAAPKIIPVAMNSGDGIPTEYKLYQNFPNPFNPTTTIQFDLPEPSIVTLKVYNILGQEVVTLMDREQMDEGQSQVQFNGNRLASGVYFYRLVTESLTNPDDGTVSGRATVSIKKMLLIK